MAKSKVTQGASAEVTSDPYQYRCQYREREGFTAKTVCGLFVERCQKTPNKVAIRFKNKGIWKEIIWQEYYEHAEAFGIGLLELGLERGDRVAMMSQPRPEWFYFDMGVQGAGGIPHGIYLTSSPSQVQFVMEKGGAKIFVGVDKGVVDRVLSVADSLPNLKKIIVIDPQGMLPFADPRLISFQEVEEMGRKRKEKEPGLFKQKVSEVQEEDIASIMWTTGTTGPPKGAMCSHRSALATLNWPDVFPEYAGPNERVLNYLPPEHGFGRSFDIWMPIETGAVIYIGEGPAKMMEAFREVQPTLLVAAPRTLEKYATEALAEVEKSGRLKQIAYRAAAWVGRSVLRRRWEGKQLLHWWFLNLLARQLVFNSILKKVGFLKTNYIAVGGTMVPPRVMTLWQMWGLEARELYAGAESGYVTFQVGRWPKPGSAGKKVPWVELKVTNEGELLTRGPGQFSGYWADEEATKKAKGSGWVNTGDIVEVLKGGEYKIIDRIKEIIITSGGENLSPLVIEDALKTSPYISEAAAFGDAHKYPVALIGIDFNKVSDWARSRGIPHTSYASLAQDPQVFKLIEEEVKKGNAQLARVQQVKQFRITPQELHPGEGGWYKISRRRLYEQYHDLIESMYADEKSRIGMEVGELAKDLKEIGEIA